MFFTFDNNSLVLNDAGNIRYMFPIEMRTVDEKEDIEDEQNNHCGQVVWQKSQHRVFQSHHQSVQKGWQI
jgi:hypothetical protein